MGIARPNPRARCGSHDSWGQNPWDPPFMLQANGPSNLRATRTSIRGGAGEREVPWVWCYRQTGERVHILPLPLVSREISLTGAHTAVPLALAERGELPRMLRDPCGGCC